MINPSDCCTKALAGEECSDGYCTLRHGVFQCSCGRILIQTIDIKPHLAGQQHRLSTAQQTKQTASTSIPRPPRSYTVSHIAVLTPNDSASRRNRKKRVDTILSDISKSEENKYGVSLSEIDGVDFGLVEEGDEEAFHTVTLTKTDNDTVMLHSFMIASQGQDRDTRFSVSLVGNTKRRFTLSKPKVLKIHFHPSYPGVYEDTLALSIENVTKNQRFIITRKLKAEVGSKADYEALQRTAPYLRSRVKYQPYTGELDFSLRPPVWTKTEWTSFLPKYVVPTEITNLSAGKTREILEAVKRILPKFSYQTYALFFQILLWINEDQLQQDLDLFAMESMQLKPNHPRYNLEVAGLAEGRPSVLVGDFILVRQSSVSNNEPWIQGCVHNIYEDYVSLKFPQDFSTYRGTTFDVRFVLNRLPQRRMHFAVTTKSFIPRLLFPAVSHLKRRTRITSAERESIIPINRLLRDDLEQMETVAAIVHQPQGSVPFIVFGPPGTGKTVTIIEAILQLLQKNPDTRILACAPNNSAADRIATLLSSLGILQLFRLNSFSRKFSDLPPSLQQHSEYNSSQVFAMPTAEKLSSFAVIVSTCISGGIPSGLGFKKGHFSHIFIDEVGQASEPEVMIPIKTMADKNTNVILSGDPQQLGPIIRSHTAADLGLKTSYLSRLMAMPIYGLDGECVAGGRGVTIVKLLKNFRNHPSILKFSNQHFYGGELEAHGNAALIHSLEQYERLPKKTFPLIFHSIIGKDDREKSSPSFFNIAEAIEVKKYCMSLLGLRRNKIQPTNIIVIAPYHAQVMKIRALFLRESQYPQLSDIKVGSVEEFQGQERRVVILSTVRSSEKYVNADIRANLGFVANPQRLNVAITRAQALLIVIGNPLVLSLDPLWNAFLQYIHTHGGWSGGTHGWKPSGQSTADRALVAQEDMLARIKAMLPTEDFEAENDDELDHQGFAFGRPTAEE